MARPKKLAGSFSSRLSCIELIQEEDLSNPFTFFNLFGIEDDEKLNHWMRKHNLLTSYVKCEKCQTFCNLNSRKGKLGGESFRCPKNRNHEYSTRKYSFFERSKLNNRDIMVFIRSYLYRESLYRCSVSSGMDYK